MAAPELDMLARVLQLGVCQPFTEGTMESSDARPNLLIVEDNVETRDALSILLRQKDYRVIAVADGKQALDCLTAGMIPDLILLDMLLPILDGWNFLQRLERDFLSHPIPIIITTGIILSPEWASANGCAGFLKKPVEPEKLFREVDRCLRRSRLSNAAGCAIKRRIDCGAV
jgi:CheY-like chemotaxis protein